MLHDLREGGPTDGATLTIDLGERPDGTFDHRGVFIPPGVAHGFAALTDMVITYLVDGYYNPEDELGVAWDDPAIDADWGVTEPTLSKRDQSNPARADLPAGRRPYWPHAHMSERGRKILVTGGAGFIGSNYVRHVLATTDDSVTVYDALTYAGNLSTLRDVDDDPRYQFVKGNICDPETLEDAMRGHDAVVHFAAESHVDRSIVGPDDFIHTNCFGTNVVMDTARRLEIARVVHIGTDEVYGSVEVGSSRETDPLEPRSPYSASKAGSDLIALSYHHTYGLPVTVTRCTNNFGPYQFPEKAIPLFTTNLLDGGKIPLYGDGLNERDWIYVDDHCAGVQLVLDCRRAGRDLQHRRRQRDRQPRPGRQAARHAGQGRGARWSTSPTASATTAATRSTSPRSRPSAGRGSARSTRRWRRRWRGTATTAGGGNRSSSAAR